MFSPRLKNSINGWGTVFRFITPLMLTVGLWILSDMKNEIREVRQTAKEVAVASITYNTNHLSHHSLFEKEICERLAKMETEITRINR
jgi:hypothetical protein